MPFMHKGGWIKTTVFRSNGPPIFLLDMQTKGILPQASKESSTRMFAMSLFDTDCRRNGKVKDGRYIP